MCRFDDHTVCLRNQRNMKSQQDMRRSQRYEVPTQVDVRDSDRPRVAAQPTKEAWTYQAGKSGLRNHPVYWKQAGGHAVDQCGRSVRSVSLVAAHHDDRVASCGKLLQLIDRHPDRATVSGARGH